MSKQTREEKRAEESRIIAEMEEAIRERDRETVHADAQASQPPQTDTQASPAPMESTPAAPKTNKGKKGYHCPRCKSLLQEDGRCPTCGYKMYIPMDEKKRNKIRLIVAAVCMVIFVVLFVILQFKK